MASNVSFKTLVIAVVFSVILSTSIVVYVPQVQDAIRGPQGEQGIQGVQGIQGPQGERGLIGQNGDPGPIGLTGEQGLPGPIGPQGIQGVKGNTGDIGPIGPSGFGELIHDSGWLEIESGSSLDICQIENDNIFVYMIGRGWFNIGNQREYGGEEGAYWSINSITKWLYVHRCIGEKYFYNEIRVWVWQLPLPESLPFELAPIDDSGIIVIP